MGSFQYQVAFLIINNSVIIMHCKVIILVSSISYHIIPQCTRNPSELLSSIGGSLVAAFFLPFFLGTISSKIGR